MFVFFFAESNRLVITSATNNDTGTYRCEASNGESSSSSSLDIRVDGKIFFVQFKYSLFPLLFGDTNLNLRYCVICEKTIFLRILNIFSMLL